MRIKGLRIGLKLTDCGQKDCPVDIAQAITKTKGNPNTTFRITSPKLESFQSTKDYGDAKLLAIKSETGVIQIKAIIWTDSDGQRFVEGNFDIADFINKAMATKS